MLQWTMGYVSLSILVSSGYRPRSGIAESYADFIPSFLRNLHTILYSGCYQFRFPSRVQECSLFSTPSPAFIVCRLFDDDHSDWCEVIHCGFDFHFSNNERCWAFFMHLLAIWMCSLKKCLLRCFSHFLTGLFAFLLLTVYELLVYFGN